MHSALRLWDSSCVHQAFFKGCGPQSQGLGMVSMLHGMIKLLDDGLHAGINAVGYGGLGNFIKLNGLGMTERVKLEVAGCPLM